jgi:uncharacterized integral membrane protein
MDNQQSFKRFYDKELSPILEKLEVKRKSTAIFIYASLIFGIIDLLIFFYLFTNLLSFDLSLISKSDFIIAIVILIILSIIGAIFYKAVIFKKLQEARLNYKKTIINEIVKFVDPELKYFEHKLISQEEYEASNLFPVKADYFYGEDYVVGREDTISYKFSELKTQFILKDHRGRKQVNPVFYGLFFIADLHKSFKAKTVILPDTAKKYFGVFGEYLQKWNVFRDTMVKTHHVDFDKEFVVYSNNPEETLKELNHQLLNRILEFKAKHNHKILLSLVDSKVNVAIPLKVDLFEPQIFSTLFNYEAVYQNYKYLQLATAIVSDLQLNDDESN